MDTESALRERLRKIEALFAGAGTPGERDAAGAALRRIRARLDEAKQSSRPVEMQFSIHDPWSRKLFIALARRYGLRPFRHYRQRRTTLMLEVPQAFLDTVFWPEFQELDMALRTYLDAVTERVIQEEVHKDTADAEERAEVLKLR